MQATVPKRVASVRVIAALERLSLLDVTDGAAWCARPTVTAAACGRTAQSVRTAVRLRNVTMVPAVTMSRSTAKTDGSLPVEQYVAQLARKRMAAGVLFRDVHDRVLLVEPSYKPNWEIPGGAVEADESPWAAATREIAEELTWDRHVGRLLVVDYVMPQDHRPEGVVFVFDGGVVDETDVARMAFADSELISASFHTLDEARYKVKPLLADRLVAALGAVGEGTTVLCEQGRRIA